MFNRMKKKFSIFFENNNSLYSQQKLSFGIKDSFKEILIFFSIQEKAEQKIS